MAVETEQSAIWILAAHFARLDAENAALRGRVDMLELAALDEQLARRVDREAFETRINTLVSAVAELLRLQPPVELPAFAEQRQLPIMFAKPVRVSDRHVDAGGILRAIRGAA